MSVEAPKYFAFIGNIGCCRQCSPSGGIQAAFLHFLAQMEVCKGVGGQIAYIARHHFLTLQSSFSSGRSTWISGVKIKLGADF